jgi:hypothetical protein
MPAEYNPRSSDQQLSPEQVARILYDVGFRGEALFKMLSIGWRESKWNPNAHRSDRPKSDLSGDMGLFQINFTFFKDSATGPENQDQLRLIGATSGADLFDPVINARAAWVISRGGTSFFGWRVIPKVGWDKNGHEMAAIPVSIMNQARDAIVAAGLGSEISNLSPQRYYQEAQDHLASLGLITETTGGTTQQPAAPASQTSTMTPAAAEPSVSYQPPELLLPDWLDIQTLEEALRGPRTPGPQTTPRATDGVMMPVDTQEQLATIARAIFETNIASTGPSASVTPAAAAPANQVPTSQYALEEIAQFLNDDAAQYLLDPESMNRGSLPFKREVRLVLDKLRNDPNNISSQELLQLRYVAEGGRSVVERDIRPIVNSVQDGSYQPPAPQVTPQRPPASTVPTTTVPAPTTTQPSPTTTQPAPTTTQPPSTTTTTVPGIREEFIFSGSTGQSTIIDGGMPIPDSAKQLLRQILQLKYVLYIDGANPSTVTQDERNLLNNILRNFQYVDFTDPRFLAMLQLPDPNDSARATLQMIENERAGILGQQPSQIVLPDISTLPQLPGEIPEGGVVTPAPESYSPAGQMIENYIASALDKKEAEEAAAKASADGTDDPKTNYVYDGLEPVVTDDPFAEIYGYWWAIVNEEPELMKLIETAKAEKWGALEFQYELEQTTWWKTTSSYARQFDVEMSRDPATTQARIDTVAEQIRQLALDRNLRLSSASLNEIARNAVRFGWSEQQTLNMLGTEALKSEDGVTALRYGFYGNKINEIAADYGVTISDTEFSQLVNKFAVGKENEESLTASFQTKATALFPAISDRLMAGETFSDIVDPYRERASNILERDFDVTDFTQNDNLAQAVTFVGDDGKQRPMTYTEWGNYLRSNRDFGYEYTDEAVGRAYQVANRIADLFGAI